MTLRLGHLNYLNAYPIYTGLSTGEVASSLELVTGHPAELNALLARGELDLSLISAYEYLKGHDHYELLPRLCIAAARWAMSVTFYVKGAVEDLDGVPVALTSQSASSARLVRILCALKWHVKPQFEVLRTLERATTYPAFMLIGDQALKHPHYPGYRSIDLANEWFQLTDLPMTFAVFAARREVMEDRGDEVVGVVNALQESLCWGELHRSDVVRLAVERSKLSPELIEEYYTALSYWLGPREQQGLERFGELSHRLEAQSEALV